MATIRLPGVLIGGFDGLSERLKKLHAVIVVWRRRAASRRALGALDAHMLKDLGLSPGEASFEADKPFWRE